MTERYLWADTTRLLATYDAEGTLLMRFLYADARTPFAADTPAGRIFFAYDQTGSLRTVTAEDGSLLKSVSHDSFGNLIADSAPDLAVPLGFAGGLYDADTGLTLFGARDYDAELGRWIAKDPIGFAGGDANLYGYCLGDPVNLVDPSGLTSIVPVNPRDTVTDKQPENLGIVREFMKDSAPVIPSAIDRINAAIQRILDFFDLFNASSDEPCLVFTEGAKENVAAQGHPYGPASDAWADALRDHGQEWTTLEGQTGYVGMTSDGPVRYDMIIVGGDGAIQSAHYNMPESELQRYGWPSK